MGPNPGALTNFPSETASNTQRSCPAGHDDSNRTPQPSTIRPASRHGSVTFLQHAGGRFRPKEPSTERTRRRWVAGVATGIVIVVGLFCVVASLDEDTVGVLFGWAAVVAVVPALWYWAEYEGFDDFAPVLVYLCTTVALGLVWTFGVALLHGSRRLLELFGGRQSRPRRL